MRVTGLIPYEAESERWFNVLNVSDGVPWGSTPVEGRRQQQGWAELQVEQSCRSKDKAPHRLCRERSPSELSQVGPRQPSFPLPAPVSCWCGLSQEGACQTRRSSAGRGGETFGQFHSHRRQRGMKSFFAVGSPQCPTVSTSGGKVHFREFKLLIQSHTSWFWTWFYLTPEPIILILLFHCWCKLAPKLVRAGVGVRRTCSQVSGLIQCRSRWRTFCGIDSNL